MRTSYRLARLRGMSGDLLRLLGLALLVNALAGCGSRVETVTNGGSFPLTAAGWHYSRNGGLPAIAYGFGPPSMASVVGHCDRLPIFALFDKDNFKNAATLSLGTDGRTRTFRSWQGVEHGGPLFVANLETSFVPVAEEAENLRIAHDLSVSRTPIVVRTNDGWTGECRQVRAPQRSSVIASLFGVSKPPRKDKSISRCRCAQSVAKRDRPPPCVVAVQHCRV